MPSKNVCVMGMGFVGLTLATALAEVGFRVYGIENSPHVLASLRQGKPHFKETGLDQKFAEHFKSGRLTIHETLPTLTEPSVYIITVGTPVSKDKSVSLKSITAVSSAIANVMKAGSTIILRSTVKVGTSRGVVKPVLDAVNVPYNLAMCPERTIEGKALQELGTLPQIVGGADAASAASAAEFFAILGCKIKTVSSLEAAEMVKLICNTQRDLYFAYANEVALMADELGLNAHELISAANFDYARSRVAMPGLVGGPCLEKDTYIMAEGLTGSQYTPELCLQARTLNENTVDYAVQRVTKIMPAPKKVAVLGTAFKGEPETDDVRGSLAIRLLDQLKTTFPKAELFAYDPVVSNEEAARWGITQTADLQTVLKSCDLVFLQNNHKAFHGDALKPYMALLAENAIFYDFWNCTAPTIAEGIKVRRIGLGIP